MPIYEYQCPPCQRKFELLRPFSRADEPATCPLCQRTATKRCLSTVASAAAANAGPAATRAPPAASGHQSA
jgi:putative FmdB family regulatory protein